MLQDASRRNRAVRHATRRMSTEDKHKVQTTYNHVLMGRFNW